MNALTTAEVKSRVLRVTEDAERFEAWLEEIRDTAFQAGYRQRGEDDDMWFEDEFFGEWEDE